VDGGLVAHDELVIPSGHRPVPLEPVDPALHRMAQPAPGPPVGGLVILLRDHRADAAAAQQRPVGAAAVGLVGQHPIGPGAGTPRATPRHPDAAQHRGELGAVTALAGGDHDRQRPLTTLDGQMQLAAQPSPRTAKPVVLRLVVDPARFSALPLPPLWAPARVLHDLATDKEA
jgi:hypothetical protein